MKRLTKVFAETTHGTKGYEAVNKINTDTESIHNLSEIITTLGELEDVLESWHIENLEELKTRLHDCQVYHLKNNSNETLIHNLKNELADLEHRLEVADKALELACSHIPCKTCPNSNGAGICYIAQDIGYYQPKENCNIDNSYYFKLKAEKEMKGE